MFSRNNQYSKLLKQKLDVKIPPGRVKIQVAVTRVSNKILKICAYVSRHLVFAFNTSLTLGICPDHLNYSIVN